MLIAEYLTGKDRLDYKYQDHLTINVDKLINEMMFQVLFFRRFFSISSLFLSLLEPISSPVTDFSAPFRADFLSNLTFLLSGREKDLRDCCLPL